MLGFVCNHERTVDFGDQSKKAVSSLCRLEGTGRRWIHEASEQIQGCAGEA